MPNEILCVGLLEHNEGCSDHRHKEDSVFSPMGIARCQIATDYKSPMRLLVRNKRCQTKS